jgi:hypothetical protein
VQISKQGFALDAGVHETPAKELKTKRSKKKNDETSIKAQIHRLGRFTHRAWWYTSIEAKASA